MEPRRAQRVGGAEMSEFSWSRLVRATADVLGRARGAYSMCARGLAWLVLFGAPTLAKLLVPERLFSVSPYGVALWMAVVLIAFALSVHAVYDKQAELDTQTDSARAERSTHRRKMLAEMRRITMALTRMQYTRKSLVLAGMQGSPPAETGAAQTELSDALDSFLEGARKCEPYEALVFDLLGNELATALEHELSLHRVTGRLIAAYKKLAKIEQHLDDEELEVVTSIFKEVFDAAPSEDPPSPRTDS